MIILKEKDFTKFKDFLVVDNINNKIIFSTAEEGRSFNRHTEEGLIELKKLKEDFKVNDVLFLRQIHSGTVFTYSGEAEKIFNENEGDAIITNKLDVAIGVFTADCVPIILVDEKKQVAAAVHSGWKGTFNSITLKTIEKFKNEYNCDASDIKAYIGPHIRKCCYEISEELKKQFSDKKDIPENILFKGRNLDMKACILEDLKTSGVKEENINDLNLCTYCSKEVKLHSYRKSKGLYGRLFTFIILRQV